MADLRAGNCFIRIWRPTRSITEAKRRGWPDCEDIYGADKRATIHRDYDEIAMLGDGAISLQTGVLTTYADLDLQPGYYVEVKKERYEDGVLEAVSETVTANPALGATTLLIADTVRFEPGDHCVLSDASGDFVFRLKAVTENTSLTLYSDQALPRAFTSATVAAKEMWIIEQARRRPGYHEWQDVRVRQVPVTDIT